MSRPKVKLSVRKKLLFGLAATAGFFLLLELSLALAGVQPLYLTEDPFVGFQPGAKLFVPDGEVMRTNSVKLCFFNPQSFPVKKGPDTYRIFCLGGSTTFGTLTTTALRSAIGSKPDSRTRIRTVLGKSSIAAAFPTPAIASAC